MSPFFPMMATAGIFVPPLHYIHQHGRRLQIVVPGIVMNDLEIPSQFSGIGIERHQGVAEQILSLSGRRHKNRRRAIRREEISDLVRGRHS